MSEIGLFRRLPGTELFATRVKSGSTIELGENVELRSIVRKGDGKSLRNLTPLIRNWFTIYERDSYISCRIPKIIKAFLLDQMILRLIVKNVIFIG